jgi:hypothetical protein
MRLSRVPVFSFSRKQPYLISPCPFIHVVVRSDVWRAGKEARLIKSDSVVSMEGVFFS